MWLGKYIKHGLEQSCTSVIGLIQDLKGAGPLGAVLYGNLFEQYSHDVLSTSKKYKVRCLEGIKNGYPSHQVCM